MALFEYAIIKSEKKNKAGDVVEREELLTPPTTLLAADATQAKTIADRAIPQEIIDSGELARVTVVVRPF